MRNIAINAATPRSHVGVPVARSSSLDRMIVASYCAWVRVTIGSNTRRNQLLSGNYYRAGLRNGSANRGSLMNSQSVSVFRKATRSRRSFDVKT
jgi:hypothetical protein